jgi:hypothetical protein
VVFGGRLVGPEGSVFINTLPNVIEGGLGDMMGGSVLKANLSLIYSLSR